MSVTSKGRLPLREGKRSTWRGRSACCRRRDRISGLVTFDIRVFVRWRATPPCVRLPQHMQNSTRTNMMKILAGTVAGLAATVPMTAAMIAMHRYLPLHQRYPLPPRKVTMRLASALDMRHELNRSERSAATVAAHFGYGGAMGGIFSLLTSQTRRHRVTAGIGWGLFVWAGSYLGLLPALGLHEPATRHPRERNVLMILAHVVWGATLGALSRAYESVRRGPQRLQVGRRQRPARSHQVGAHR